MSPLQKFDIIHAKYLTAPRERDFEVDTSGVAGGRRKNVCGVPTSASEKKQKIQHDSILAQNREQARIEKGAKKDKESFRTTMVNIVM